MIVFNPNKTNLEKPEENLQKKEENKSFELLFKDDETYDLEEIQKSRYRNNSSKITTNISEDEINLDSEDNSSLGNIKISSYKKSYTLSISDIKNSLLED